MAITGALSGGRYLVVEDEFFIADELTRELKAAGAEVIGPFNRADAAREALLKGAIASAAVLDINIGGTLIYPLADELAAAGIPLVFATGYDAEAIPSRFADVPRLLKPIDAQVLVALLAASHLRLSHDD